MAYYLGIDIGTSSLKMMLKSANGLYEYTVSYGYKFSSPHNGYAEQDPEEWWQACKACFQNLKEKYAVDLLAIKAISFSGQMHGLVALDKNKKVIRPSIIHCDARSKEQLKLLAHTISYEQQIRVLGNSFYSGFLLPSLLWMKENEPENYAEIRYLLLPKDYITFRLSGQLSSDFSDASGTLSFDIVKQEWSQEILDLFNIPRAWFPKLYEIGDVLGVIDREVAAEIGLSPSTLIVVGGGDQIMQGIGNAVLDFNQASLNIGTSAQVSFQADTPVKNGELNTNLFCGYKKNRWVSACAIMNGGLSYSWLCRLLGIQDLRAMDQEVAKISVGSNGLIFLPYLTGERTPHMNPNLSAVFAGLDINTTQAEMARAVLEGVVYALYQGFGILVQQGLQVDFITASGGAANSQLWLQIQADVFNLPIKITKCKEQASLGAVIAAAVGAGEFGSIKDACTAYVSYENSIFLPDEEAHTKYKEFFFLYKRLQSDIIRTLEDITVLGRESS